MFESSRAKQLWYELNDAIDEAPVIVGCRGNDPEAWFPDEDSMNYLQYTDAKKLCAPCPVKSLCLEYALANNEAHGLWGGLTYRERLKLKRK